MPPKKQNTKEQIIEKAFDIVRASGHEELSARKLAKELCCSTQPIYQTFPDMISLKAALVKRAQSIMMNLISEYEKEGNAHILANVLGYVQFAEQEKNLYRLMYSPELSRCECMQPYYPHLNPDELNLLIYAHGIVMMQSYGTLEMSQDTIKNMIIHAYELFCSEKQK